MNENLSKELYVGRVFWLASNNGSNPEPIQISSVRNSDRHWVDKPNTLVVSFNKKVGLMEDCYIFLNRETSLAEEMREHGIFLSEKEAAKESLRICQESFARRVAKLKLLIERDEE